MPELHLQTTRPPTAQPQGCFSERGVGMIEVLVTLFILSIGLLGVASLQFISAFANSDALSRSQAVMVAQQFSERLRANAYMAPTGNGMVVDNAYFDSNLYNFSNLSCAVTGLTTHQCFCQSIPAAIPNCQTANCSAAQFAAYDAYESSCAAVASNPGTELSLNCTDKNATDTLSCSPGSRHHILLRWPVENWQGNNRVLNTECNVGVSEPHDCVRLDITL